VAAVSVFQASAWRRIVRVDAVLPPYVPTRVISWSRAAGDGAVFAGRLSPEKGAAEAIGIARAAGVPIDVYGDGYDAGYSREQIGRDADVMRYCLDRLPDSARPTAPGAGRCGPPMDHRPSRRVSQIALPITVDVQPSYQQPALDWRFHTAVRTIWPCQARSCGKLTFTDSNRPTLRSVITCFSPPVRAVAPRQKVAEPGPSPPGLRCERMLASETDAPSLRSERRR